MHFFLKQKAIAVCYILDCFSKLNIQKLSERWAIADGINLTHHFTGIVNYHVHRDHEIYVDELNAPSQAPITT